MLRVSISLFAYCAPLFFFSSRRRHTRYWRDWSSDVCSSDLGELVILDRDGSEQFDALQNRLHPAESRVRMLAEQTPALFRAFDLLAADRRQLIGKPFSERRAALEDLIAAAPGRKKTASGSLELTPMTTSAAKAEPWLLS